MSQDKPVLPEVVRFLLGECPLDGHWYGEKPLDKPMFWWRKQLRAALERQGSGKWVPLEPTPEQWQEFYDRVWDSDEANPTLALPVSELQRIGRAMLAAAPQAQDAQTVDGKINEPPQAGQGLCPTPSPEGHAAGPASGSPDEGGPNPQTSLRPPVNPV